MPIFGANLRASGSRTIKDEVYLYKIRILYETTFLQKFYLKKTGLFIHMRARRVDDGFSK